MRTYRNAAAVGLFVLSALFSYRLAALGGGYSPLWLSTGAGVGVLYLLGVRAWPVLLLVNLAGNLMLPESLTVFGALSAAVGTGTSALGVRVALWKRSEGGLFGGLSAMTFFLLSAGLSPALFGAAFGLLGIPPEIRQIHTFVGWVVSDLTGVVILAPAMIALLGADRKRKTTFTIEASLFVALFSVLCLGVFGQTIPSRLAEYPLPFLLAPFLLWAAFRFGTIFFIDVLSFSAVVSLTGSFFGRGPYAVYPFETSIVVTQVFLIVLGGLALLFHAASLEGDFRLEAMAEQRRSLERLNEQLEAEIRERTLEVLRSISDIRLFGDRKDQDDESAGSRFVAFRLSNEGTLWRASAGLAQALGYASSRALLEMESMVPGGFLLGRKDHEQLMEAARRRDVMTERTLDLSGQGGLSKRLTMDIRAVYMPDGALFFVECVAPDPRIFGAVRGDVFDDATGLPDLRYLDGIWTDNGYLPGPVDFDCALGVLRISPSPVPDARFRRCLEHACSCCLRSLDPIVRSGDGELAILLFGVGGMRGGREVMATFRKELASRLEAERVVPSMRFGVTGILRNMSPLQIVNEARKDLERRRDDREAASARGVAFR